METEDCKEESRLKVELDGLRKGTNELSNVIDELCERLSGILIPSESAPVPLKSLDGKKTESKVVGLLESEVHGLNVQIGRINDILQRLQC